MTQPIIPNIKTRFFAGVFAIFVFISTGLSLLGQGQVSFNSGSFSVGAGSLYLANPHSFNSLSGNVPAQQPWLTLGESYLANPPFLYSLSGEAPTLGGSIIGSAAGSSALGVLFDRVILNPGYSIGGNSVQFRPWSSIVDSATYSTPIFFITNVFSSPQLPEILIPPFIFTNRFNPEFPAFPAFPTVSNSWQTNFFAEFAFPAIHGILWQHEDGRFAIWAVDGTNFVGAMTVPRETSFSDPNWRGIGLVDFEYDGRLDVLLRHRNGQFAYSKIRNNKLCPPTVLAASAMPWYTTVGQTVPTSSGPGFFYWESGPKMELWTGDQIGLIGQEAFNRGIRTPLNPVAVGDFDSDSYKDLLLQDNGMLRVRFWKSGIERCLNNCRPVTPDWKVAGVADFNNDIQPDILWKNVDGRLAVWLMSGTTRIGTVLLRNGQPAAGGWKIVVVK